MEPTERLHHSDPRGRPFTARIVARAAWQGRRSVVLDRTGFYPESGGQMADRGRLAGVPVLDVQVDEGDRVHHVIDGELPPVGAEVRGEVDQARRRVHRALHTGQHLLSRALFEAAGAETVSARLGETACTVDVDKAALPEAALAAAEDLANAVIDDDLPVRAWFPEPGELEALPLRRAAKVAGPVRIVAAGTFDYTPCGGTHCDATGQVGLVRVASVERYKGGTRVTFVAGARARADYAAQAGLLRELGRQLTCGPRDLAGVIDKLRGELQVARESAGALRARLADREAAALLALGGPVFVAELPGDDAAFLRAVARRLVEAPGAVVALAAPGADGTRLLVARGPGAAVDCNAVVRAVAASTGGRGGGKPDAAEALLPAGADWRAALPLAGGPG